MLSRLLLPTFLALLLGLTPPATAAEPAYISLWAQSHRVRTDLERGTLLGDFHRAAATKTLKTAAGRWTTFLRTHAPAAGEEADDALQARLARIARIEMARIYYLQQRPAEGDRLIKGLIEKP